MNLPSEAENRPPGQATGVESMRRPESTNPVERSWTLRPPVLFEIDKFVI